MNSISSCTISSERVNDLDAGFFEIARIPRGNGQAMNERSRGDQTVLEPHRVTGSAESCQQLPSASSRKSGAYWTLVLLRGIAGSHRITVACQPQSLSRQPPPSF